MEIKGSGHQTFLESSCWHVSIPSPQAVPTRSLYRSYSTKRGYSA